MTVSGSTDRTNPNFISVKKGAQIYANGTPDQPITFTGPEAVPGSWAGIVIAGNSICNDGTEAQSCQFEAVPDITYGSTTPVLDDNSGSLRYVRIRLAGQQIAPNEELNSLTLLAVGNGTVLDHVQEDGGLDDGIEFFGGSVNGRHLVCSNRGDDCFDFDQGYAGKLQFLLGYQGSNRDMGGDSNGIESDNDSSNNDKQPRTQPQISNITLVGAGSVGNEGIRLRRGTGGNYTNLTHQVGGALQAHEKLGLQFDPVAHAQRRVGAASVAPGTSPYRTSSDRAVLSTTPPLTPIADRWAVAPETVRIRARVAAFR